ncbi:MAG: GNAT family protein [Phycisphaerales bacterium]
MTAPAQPPAWTHPGHVRPSWTQEGVLLRPFRADDAAELFRAVDSSRDSLHPWLPWAITQHHSVAASAEAISTLSSLCRDEAGEDWACVLGIFDAVEGTLLGGTGFNRVSRGVHNAEAGYWLRSSARGRGWCTRALRACLEWGFTPQQAGGFGWRRVHVFASALNAASCAVPRRLGLRQHMHASRDRWVEGLGWSDTLGWEVLAEEWPTLHRSPGANAP